jgi:glycosyltransferase involved in cell wall biosynthesis
LKIIVLIPAYNEQDAIAAVIKAIPAGLIEEVIVCDNGSTDQTAIQAGAAGATVVNEPRRGYGNACLKGLAYIASKPETSQPDIVVFLDGDYSDHPEEMPLLISPMATGLCDMVIGSRVLGDREPGSLTPQQVFGNWLATLLIRWLYGYRFSDLGPFRAIRYQQLVAMKMADKNYGWTVEMQVKAAKMNLRCEEAAVSYRRRIGISKVSGTIKGSILAGYKILWTVFKLKFLNH